MDPVSVVAFGAHPDDDDIKVGGTAALWAARGDRVLFVSVANGEEVLSRTLIDIVRDTGGPRGVAAFGYGEEDVPGLVEGTLKQQRLLSCCPRPVGAGELAAIIRESMSY